MALRKCPGCKNTIAAETLTCPICGCNPRTCRLRKILFWTSASALTLVLVGTRVRQHASGLGLVGPPTQAVPGAGR
jgi:hypothetical protein